MITITIIIIIKIIIIIMIMMMMMIIIVMMMMMMMINVYKCICSQKLILETSLRNPPLHIVCLLQQSIQNRMTSSNGFFLRYWPFVRGIHRWPVNSPHKGQWRWTLMFPLICAWTNGWANSREAVDLGRHRTHYDVTVLINIYGTRPISEDLIDV